MSDLYEVDDSNDSEDSDQTETYEMSENKMEVSDDEIEQVKDNVRERYGYDEMSEEDKKAFDEQLDQYCEDNFDVIDGDKETDKVDEGDKVKKLIR
jgi:hypothetical protein